jgi:hypothetical protein
MSELIITHPRTNARWQLLATASALVLMACASAPANAEGSNRPQLWIELGGSFDRLQNSQEIYTPSFVALTPPEFDQPQGAERPPRYGFDESLALTFQPKNSDWSFSAGIRYGRASSRKIVHHQSSPGPYVRYAKVMFTNTPVPTTTYIPVSPYAARFTDAKAKQSESHAVLDFQVGKDVGLGLFGRHANSSLEVGVRFAQFISKSDVELKENPDWHFSTFKQTVYFPPNPKRGKPGRTVINQFVNQPFHSYAGSFEANRSFHGVGPSIAWQSSQSLIGDEEKGELAFDWGVNAALLFGRQRTKVQHQTTGQYNIGTRNSVRTNVYQTSATPPARSRTVTVPNLGGFAGISYRYTDVRFKLGYRADWFFNAMDGGIDARQNEDRGFHGPYASISIGLGG